MSRKKCRDIYGLINKNDFRDGEAIAEAVQRPTMKFVATKTAEQLDLQALHRVRSRLVGQRTGIINQIRNKLARIAWAVLNKEHNFECTRTNAMTSRPA